MTSINLNFTDTDAAKVVQHASQFINDWSENEGVNDPECDAAVTMLEKIEPILQKTASMLALIIRTSHEMADATFVSQTSLQADIANLLDELGYADFQRKVDQVTAPSISDVTPTPLNMLVPPVSAEVHDDNWLHIVKFDAAPWFAQASDQAILALAAIEWGCNEAADRVVEHFETANNEIAKLFAYCRATQDLKNSVGFECVIDERSAMGWLERHRPTIWKRIDESNDIGL